MQLQLDQNFHLHCKNHLKHAKNCIELPVQVTFACFSILYMFDFIFITFTRVSCKKIHMPKLVTELTKKGHFPFANYIYLTYVEACKYTTYIYNAKYFEVLNCL